MTSLSHSRPACPACPACPRQTRRFSLLDAIALYRQRRALAHLDDAALDDIGLTRSEAQAEARRPFWDIPHPV